MSDILIWGYNRGVVIVKCLANDVTLYCHILKRRWWWNSTLPLKASSSVVLWWVWGHQHSACRASAGIGSWQSAVALNIANLKNTKGEAFSSTAANHALAWRDALCSILPPPEETGWARDHTIRILSFLTSLFYTGVWRFKARDHVYPVAYAGNVSKKGFEVSWLSGWF